MAWVRGGHCCRCGDCCVGSPPGEAEPVKGMCPRLVDAADGTRVCSVHDTDHYYWNAACSKWPSHPGQIAHLPRCTFTFTEVDDGD